MTKSRNTKRGNQDGGHLEITTLFLRHRFAAPLKEIIESYESLNRMEWWHRHMYWWRWNAWTRTVRLVNFATKYNGVKSNLCLLSLSSSRNPLNSNKEAVKAHWKESVFLKPALAAAGFKGIPSNDSYSYTFLPCPVGTFSNFSSKGAEGCIQCPPGMKNISLYYRLPDSLSGSRNGRDKITAS